MLTAQITIGMTVRIDVNGRLTPATVTGTTGEGRSRRYCVRRDYGTEHTLPASALWPVADTVVGGVRTTGGQIVAPRAVPGVRINRRRPMEAQAGVNARRIADACGRVHVADSPLATVRAVYTAAGKRSLRNAPPAFRRGVVHAILAARAANRAEYITVMGHAPLPSEESVTAAMLSCR